MNNKEIKNVLAKSYTVHDANVDKAELIFILESPHHQELKHRIPVAGTSGATMAKCLFGADVNEPLGLLMKQYLDHGVGIKDIHKIGLMNVCQIPMQRTAYNKSDAEEHAEFFDIIEGIRTSNQKRSYKHDSWNQLQSLIVSDFRDRLLKIKDRHVILVPCGRFAQKFFTIATEQENNQKWKMIEDVPHPSYHSWKRENYQPVVQKVKNALSG